ncbi:hypothetical protein [Rhodococcus erythropolis]|uniref:hypothetical protein n=1 Tax=Rhodococcus erythropolis TaxID=1833 RepID=UPI0024B85F4F|nr:hypothetical protein [Rhodococcus erythropolis]MDJ0015513.1 hypothetical protein [Rhodococcus erythropolis]
MIWLTTDQLVETVRRSLLEQVLPVVEDEFVRVQVSAAAHALLEVADRLAGADPVATDSAAIEEVLRGWGVSNPEADSDSETAHNSALRELVAAALQSGDQAGVAQKLADYRPVESAVAARDLSWVCADAMSSLE